MFQMSNNKEGFKEAISVFAQMLIKPKFKDEIINNNEEFLNKMDYLDDMIDSEKLKYSE